MAGVKAITVPQPKATILALGVATIETRSLSTEYRGPLAIHAGVKKPEQVPVGDWRPYPDPYAEPGDWAMEHYGSGHPGAPFDQRLPLGAVVATCTLVDVVPIHQGFCRCERARVPYLLRGVGGLGREVLGLYRPDGLGICWVNHNETEHPWIAGLANPHSDPVTEQIPYGDYTCGRFAWLLANVKPTTGRCPACWGSGQGREFEGHDYGGPTPPCHLCGRTGRCEPVPAKGRQGLWEWAA